VVGSGRRGDVAGCLRKLWVAYMAPPLPPSAVRGLLLLLASLAATRAGRGAGGPPLPGGGVVGGGGVQRSFRGAGRFWGNAGKLADRWLCQGVGFAGGVG
jgi:hypothetical protein